VKGAKVLILREKKKREERCAPLFLGVHPDRPRKTEDQKKTPPGGRGRNKTVPTAEKRRGTINSMRIDVKGGKGSFFLWRKKGKIGLSSE